MGCQGFTPGAPRSRPRALCARRPAGRCQHLAVCGRGGPGPPRRPAPACRAASRRRAAPRGRDIHSQVGSVRRATRRPGARAFLPGAARRAPGRHLTRAAPVPRALGRSGACQWRACARACACLLAWGWCWRVWCACFAAARAGCLAAGIPPCRPAL
ncbi:MAG: hypothetical protein J3K34DRAFT_431804 [Monoraphidium minutum]|nr:MAG: hypothetical protein J3K34DRAFT_431804 [Monoraphidium minutum]